MRNKVNGRKKEEKQMKKLMAVLTAAVMMSTSVFAADVNVVVNGTPIESKGIIIDGRTMMPVRGVFEELGFEVNWDNATKTATLTKSVVTVKMTNGDKGFTVNGKEIVPDVPQQIVDGSFMLPLRAVAEAIGARVNWDGATSTATISTGLKVEGVLDLTDDSKEIKENTPDLSDAVSVEIISPDDPIFDKAGVNEINLD